MLVNVGFWTGLETVREVTHGFTLRRRQDCILLLIAVRSRGGLPEFFRTLTRAPARE
jgi:hypothetical protein